MDQTAFHLDNTMELGGDGPNAGFYGKKGRRDRERGDWFRQVYPPLGDKRDLAGTSPHEG